MPAHRPLTLPQEPLRKRTACLPVGLAEANPAIRLRSEDPECLHLEFPQLRLPGDVELAELCDTGDSPARSKSLDEHDEARKQTLGVTGLEGFDPFVDLCVEADVEAGRVSPPGSYSKGAIPVSAPIVLGTDTIAGQATTPPVWSQTM